MALLLLRSTLNLLNWTLVSSVIDTTCTSMRVLVKLCCHISTSKQSWWIFFLLATASDNKLVRLLMLLLLPHHAHRKQLIIIAIKVWHFPATLFAFLLELITTHINLILIVDLLLLSLSRMSSSSWRGRANSSSIVIIVIKEITSRMRNLMRSRQRVVIWASLQLLRLYRGRYLLNLSNVHVRSSMIQILI